eukprot:3515822-Pleurochrysis_carterae.AAC.1
MKSSSASEAAEGQAHARTSTHAHTSTQLCIYTQACPEATHAAHAGTRTSTCTRKHALTQVRTHERRYTRTHAPS